MKPRKRQIIFKINFYAIIRFIRIKILKKKPVPRMNFGLVRDKEDPRDKLYAPFVKMRELPSTTERKHFINFPYRWDQGSLGSCTGHGGCAGLVQAILRNGQQIFDPSKLFAYYNARTPENKTEDSGASVRDVIKGLNKYGVCRELIWPHIESKFAETPPSKAYQEAELHQALEYYRIYPVTKEAIMNAIVQGYAVVYGQILYESFMSEEVARTGIVPVPRCWEEVIGGHCKCILDYEKAGVFEVNSWSRKWGINGGCLVPWKVILNERMCFDFWVIKLVENNNF